MRVLIISNSDIGLYRFRKELMDELTKNHEVYVAVPKGEFYDEISELGCKIRETELDRHGTNPLKELELICTYWKIIRNISPDVVLTYTIKPNVYAGFICSVLKVPYIVNITGLGTAVESKGIMRKITLFLYKFGLRRANKVFFQNEANRDFMLSKGVVHTAYELIPGSGVNLEKYTLLEYPNKKTVDFVFISRIMKEKGIEQYLEAAKVLRKEYPETRFHICGFCEQDYKDELIRLQNEGVIIYHEFVKDMHSIYSMASCTVHPSFYPEGLSNVLLESAASGRPIITTKRIGCREVVEDGVNGFLVEEKNSQDLIEKIRLFLSKKLEERKDMGVAGRAKVEKEFNRQIVIERYMTELNGIG